MKWLLKTFGGTYYLMNRNRREHWKPCFMWMPKGAKNKETLLLSVLPYMIIKREQAVLALEFVRLNGERNPAKRLALYNKAALLNSRVSPTTNMPDDSDLESKIESDLMGDHESELAVTQASQTQTDQTETAAPA